MRFSTVFSFVATLAVGFTSVLAAPVDAGTSVNAIEVKSSDVAVKGKVSQSLALFLAVTQAKVDQIDDNIDVAIEHKDKVGLRRQLDALWTTTTTAVSQLKSTKGSAKALLASSNPLELTKGFAHLASSITSAAIRAKVSLIFGTTSQDGKSVASYDPENVDTAALEPETINKIIELAGTILSILVPILIKLAMGLAV